jgi:hypothetical protein
MNDLASPTQALRRLPRRDYWLLPLVSLLTVLVMAAGAEIGARVLMPEAPVDSCMTPDPVLKSRPRPNCVSMTKSAEGEWVENRYNECGYRSDTSCRTLPGGAARLVVIGSSTSWGYHIPTAKTWYMRTASALVRTCGRLIDVQNLGGILNLSQIASRVPEALALNPDAVVMTMAPYDLEEVPPGDFAPTTGEQSEAATAVPMSTLKQLQALIVSARAVLVVQHFLFRQPDTYVPLYLLYGDKADFLRPPFTPAWRLRLDYADRALGYIAEKTREVGVPFVLVFVPQQAQADIASSGRRIPGVDPFAVGAAIEEIAHRHGIVFTDMVSRFSDIPNAQDLFLNVEGHFNGDGNAAAAAVAEDALTGDGAAFTACKQRP